MVPACHLLLPTFASLRSRILRQQACACCQPFKAAKCTSCQPNSTPFRCLLTFQTAPGTRTETLLSASLVPLEVQPIKRAHAASKRSTATPARTQLGSQRDVAEGAVWSAERTASASLAKVDLESYRRYSLGRSMVLCELPNLHPRHLDTADCNSKVPLLVGSSIRLPGTISALPPRFSAKTTAFPGVELVGKTVGWSLQIKQAEETTKKSSAIPQKKQEDKKGAASRPRPLRCSTHLRLASRQFAALRGLPLLPPGRGVGRLGGALLGARRHGACR